MRHNMAPKPVGRAQEAILVHTFGDPGTGSQSNRAQEATLVHTFIIQVQVFASLPWELLNF